MDRERRIRTPAVVMSCVALLIVAVVFWAPAPAASHKSATIKDVPHVRQVPGFGGEACVEMMLRKLGHQGDQRWVFDQSGVDPVLGRGCEPAELRKALVVIGFDPGKGLHAVTGAQATGLKPLWQSLYADLSNGLPSIVHARSNDQEGAAVGFLLVVGYDAEKDQVLYHEPALESGAYVRLAREKFLNRWPQKSQDGSWTVVRLRLKAGRLKEAKPSGTFTPADYALHMRKLRGKVDLSRFHAVVEPPFVVIGDEASARVESRARHTVKWCCDHLRKLYFKKEPRDIYDVWLFKDDKSYRANAKKLFGDEPDTPYGYFSHADGGLVMNIGTGGGTLCHEIVHAFVATNFPDCPAWFNEGLGSLYEQCMARDGRLLGLTNWRLAGLQKAVKKKSVPSFQKLCATTTHHFYHTDKGTNYAQARYLCLYLQEKRRLVKYYHDFRKNCKADPTGYGTLQKILDVKDMKTWQDEWEKWVLKLRFR